MIYTFNADGFLLYPVMKAALGLSDAQVHEAIHLHFQQLQRQLSVKGIAYDSLKKALIPNQEKDRFETCLVIDSSLIDAPDYGRLVFEKLIPLLDRESSFSILCGDYIGFSGKPPEHEQQMLRSFLNERLVRCNPSRYIRSSQYYLIYINRLSPGQRLKIVDGLYPFAWFTGFADLSHGSLFKSYLSTILSPVCVKHKNSVILPHPPDYPDEENVNMRSFPFEESGFSLFSINADSYEAFLSYKIEHMTPDRNDVGFSFNALFPKFDSFEKIRLNIAGDKWDKYLTDMDRGKGGILQSLGYAHEDKERFAREIFRQICANYIYNLNQNPYGDLMFNVCIELPTIHKRLRRTTVALKYHPDTGVVDLVTIT